MPSPQMPQEESFPLEQGHSASSEELWYPIFSIVMPVFNSSAYVGEAIASVQAQTFPHWELIIVDDASSDDSLAQVQARALADDRIRVYSLADNRGPAQARNVAIENARGRFIAFLDSDDVWHPEKLEHQRALFDRTQASLVFAAYEKIGSAGERAERIVEVPPWIDYRGLLNRTVIATVTAVYDTARVGRVYMPDIAKRQDFGLWLRILRQGGEARAVQKPLASLRKRPDSLSSDKRSAVYHTWRVYREVEGLGRTRSAYHFTRYILHALGKAIR